jgi:predicted nucleic acid-binding protein
VTTRGTNHAYLDSSALIKLIAQETESEALARAVSGLTSQASSELAVVEVNRRARYFGPAAEARSRDVLADTRLRPIDRAILDHAAQLDPLRLRSLDAIHLATALSLDGLDVFISYDERLNHAASAAGLNVESPA